MRLLFVLAATLVLIPSAGANQAAGPTPFHTGDAPWGLHAFVYRADEPLKADHTYALMPAFAWTAVQGATQYDLQLATSSTFSDATTLYRQTYHAPSASIQLQVPWMTGNPYALWVHVRVVVHGRTSAWSAPFGFNTSWQQIPTRQPAPTGLIRWSPVGGATSYEVWYMNGPNSQFHFTTLTNVADEREYWTFHPAFARTINWRVRAVRLVQTASLPNGIRVESHGPYSPMFTTTNPIAQSATPLKSVSASSNVDSTPSHPRAHQLTPGFTWSGSEDASGRGTSSGLFRVYVFSDKQCVNQVMTGSVVGGPAWAPRDSDPLLLPGTLTDQAAAAGGKFLGYGPQASTFTADGTVPTPAESPATPSASAPATPSAPASAEPSSTQVAPRPVSLPDNGWPEGRYWWTVVPVVAVADDVGALEYHDLALPQDACADGQVWPFGVQSAPVTTTSQTPYASGLVSGMRVVSATAPRPKFQNLPLITWEPAMAAQTYEVELSRHVYPWVALHKQTSVVTSAVLQLTNKDMGLWYYRVRGINPNLAGPAQKLAWSKSVAIRITGSVFVIVK